MDGHNGSGNIHTHIVININSIRKYDVGHKEFMERKCDSRAGYKHHLTKEHLSFLKQAVMDMCRRENLHQVELLAPAKRRITDREYYARRRVQEKATIHTFQPDVGEQELPKNGQTHDRRTENKMAAQPTTFQTQKHFLCNAIEDAA